MRQARCSASGDVKAAVDFVCVVPRERGAVEQLSVRQKPQRTRRSGIAASIMKSMALGSLPFAAFWGYALGCPFREMGLFVCCQ
jgi:hypothetical protein